MTNHHHQSKAEQIYNKAHGAAPFHHEKMSHKITESGSLENRQDAEVTKSRPARFRVSGHQKQHKEISLNLSLTKHSRSQQFVFPFKGVQNTGNKLTNKS